MHPWVCFHSLPLLMYFFTLLPSVLFLFPLGSFSQTPLICFVSFVLLLGIEMHVFCDRLLGGSLLSGPGIDGLKWHLYADSGISIQPHDAGVNGRDLLIRWTLSRRPQRGWETIQSKNELQRLPVLCRCDIKARAYNQLLLLISLIAETLS